MPKHHVNELNGENFSSTLSSCLAEQTDLVIYKQSLEEFSFECLNSAEKQALHHSFVKKRRTFGSNTNKTEEPRKKPIFIRLRNRYPTWNDFYTVFYYVFFVFGTVRLWKIVYKHLPLRATSRVVGRLAKIPLPRWLRGPVYRSYGWLFCANLEEIEYFDDLSQYHSLADFFQRSLRPTARMIEQSASLVSPADGCILSCGRVEAGHLEQVKGLFYTIRGLLGPNTWSVPKAKGSHSTPKNKIMHRTRSATNLTEERCLCVTGHGLDYLPVCPSNQMVNVQDPTKLRQSRKRSVISNYARMEDYQYAQSLLLCNVKSCDGQRNNHEENNETHSPNLQTYTISDQITQEEKPASTDLYHLLIYLAPGDYHRFHSPADWIIQMRRHFPGKLYSVAPPFLSHLERLYCTNERVVYVGRWQFGFFAYVAVGATNVGSIKVFSDPQLVTNVPSWTTGIVKPWRECRFFSTKNQTKTDDIKNVDFEDLTFAEPIKQSKGEIFGQFNFGSTVILLFEAPVDSFKFRVSFGSRVKVGQAVGSVQ